MIKTVTAVMGLMLIFPNGGCKQEEPKNTEYAPPKKAITIEDVRKPATADIPTSVSYVVGDKVYVTNPEKDITPREAFGLSQLLMVFSHNQKYGKIDPISFQDYVEHFNLSRHLTIQ